MSRHGQPTRNTYGMPLAEVEHARDRASRAPTERPRRINRGSLPAHLERIEQVVDVEDKVCPCCGGALHQIGEDVAERKIAACIPSKANRKVSIPHDTILYRCRHKIENMFGRLKEVKAQMIQGIIQHEPAATVIFWINQ